MSWVIEHRSWLGSTYWMGDHYSGRVFKRPFGEIIERYWDFGTDPAKAKAFDSEEAVLQAYRERYRPESSCCQAVQIDQSVPDRSRTEGST